MRKMTKEDIEELKSCYGMRSGPSETEFGELCDLAIAGLKSDHYREEAGRHFHNSVEMQIERDQALSSLYELADEVVLGDPHTALSHSLGYQAERDRNVVKP